VKMEKHIEEIIRDLGQLVLGVLHFGQQPVPLSS
jgi:hypothetical protein